MVYITWVPYKSKFLLTELRAANTALIQMCKIHTQRNSGKKTGRHFPSLFKQSS